MIKAEGRFDAGFTHAVERRHQIGEALVLERAVMHAVVFDLFAVVTEPGHGQKSDAVIGSVVGHPRGIAVPELDLTPTTSVYHAIMSSRRLVLMVT